MKSFFPLFVCLESTNFLFVPQTLAYQTHTHKHTDATIFCTYIDIIYLMFNAGMQTLIKTKNQNTLLYCFCFYRVVAMQIRNTVANKPRMFTWHLKIIGIIVKARDYFSATLLLLLIMVSDISIANWETKNCKYQIY